MRVLCLLLVCCWPLSLAHAYQLKRTSSGDVVRWPSTLTAVPLGLDPGLRDFLGAGQADEAVQMATEAWRGFKGVPDIVIQDEAPPAYDPGRRGGAIYLVQPWPFEANRLAITVTSYYPTGELVGVDVLVNGDVNYGLLPEGDMPPELRAKHDLGAVLTHELGHVLGLDESHDDPAATMWPYIRSGETHQRTLSEDDESAILELYSLPLGQVVPLSCTVSFAGGQLQGPPWLALLLAALAWALLRVVRCFSRPLR